MPKNQKQKQKFLLMPKEDPLPPSATSCLLTPEGGGGRSHMLPIPSLLLICRQCLLPKAFPTSSSSLSALVPGDAA